jgi:hypothetical protein
MRLNAQISAGVKKASPASALSGFGEVWLSVTGQDTKKVGVVVDEREQKLAGAIASDDIAGTGRFWGSSDVNELRIKSSNFPVELLRKTEVCTVLDIAVGSGAISVSRCLVGFHGAKPTRETLKMALSSGKIELIEFVLERVPKGELERSRLDLLEVASDFHHGTVVAWLFRDADGFEKEQFMEVAIRCRRAPVCWRCWKKDSSRGGRCQQQESGRRVVKSSSLRRRRASGRTPAGGRRLTARRRAFERWRVVGRESRRCRSWGRRARLRLWCCPRV